MAKLKNLSLHSKEKGTPESEWPVAIVFGGDGSYMKILKNFADHGVDLNFITCCFLPFGTGNDLPRQMGWGGDAKQTYTQSLESIMRELHLKACYKKLDIWEVEVKE